MQEVSVSKAGLTASLPARTTVLAAANPAGGRYDRGRTLCENLRMSAPMLSRFDLAFVLLDRPDEERDAALSAHVLALHSGCAGRAAQAGGGKRADGRRDGGIRRLRTQSLSSVLRPCVRSRRAP